MGCCIVGRRAGAAADVWRAADGASGDAVPLWCGVG